MDERLKLGVAKADITPKIGCQLYGYLPDVFSTSVHDNLTATAFCFESGNVRAIMVSVTVCLIKTELADEIREKISKECNLPLSNIIICATHTHSGPNTIGNFGWGDIDNDYCNNIFVPNIIKACVEAEASKVYVKMGVSSGDSFIGVNRRETYENNGTELGQCPWGVFDPKMTVLSFVSEDNKPYANIIHYGMHGTCAGISTEISRDFSGVMIDSVENTTGAVTAFFNGAEGDVGPRLSNGHTIGFGDMRYVEETGVKASNDAIKIYNIINEFKDVSLECYNNEINIPLEKRLSLETAEKELAECNTSESNSYGQIRNYLRNVIKSYDDGYDEMPYYSFRQSVIKIGDIYFVSFPYEIFSEIALRINKYYKEGTVLALSNANGSKGYFSTEWDVVRGGYEIAMYQTSNIQPFAKGADYSLITETLKNIRGMQ